MDMRLLECCMRRLNALQALDLRANVQWPFFCWSFAHPSHRIRLRCVINCHNSLLDGTRTFAMGIVSRGLTASLLWHGLCRNGPFSRRIRAQLWQASSWPTRRESIKRREESCNSGLPVLSRAGIPGSGAEE